MSDEPIAEQFVHPPDDRLDATDSYLLYHANREAHRRRPDPMDPYVPDGPFSWFADKLVANEGMDAQQRARHEPAKTEPPAPGSPADDMVQVRLRLERSYLNEKQRLEQRDLSGAAGAGGEFLPVGQGLPSYVADAFARAARAQGRLLAAFPQRPLPPGSLKVEVARLSSGASVGSPPNLDPVSETDPASALITAPIGLIVGQVDLDRKLFDRGPRLGGFDVVLAEELGAAIGAAADAQVIAGSGTANQMRGLAQVSGILTTAYTDATPTQAEAAGKLWLAFSDLAGPNGWGAPDPEQHVLVVHPRRHAWFMGGTGAPNPPLALPGTLVRSAGIRTNLGAGTNEDEMYVVALEACFVAFDPVQVRLISDFAGSGNLVVRVQASMYASLVVRVPQGVNRISGTGLVSPAFP